MKDNGKNKKMLRQAFDMLHARDDVIVQVIDMNDQNTIRSGVRRWSKVSVVIACVTLLISMTAVAATIGLPMRARKNLGISGNDDFPGYTEVQMGEVTGNSITSEYAEDLNAREQKVEVISSMVSKDRITVYIAVDHVKEELIPYDENGEYHVNVYKGWDFDGFEQENGYMFSSGIIEFVEYDPKLEQIVLRLELMGEDCDNLTEVGFDLFYFDETKNDRPLILYPHITVSVGKSEELIVNSNHTIVNAITGEEAEIVEMRLDPMNLTVTIRGESTENLTEVEYATEAWEDIVFSWNAFKTTDILKERIQLQMKDKVLPLADIPSILAGWEFYDNQDGTLSLRYLFEKAIDIQQVDSIVCLE